MTKNTMINVLLFISGAAIGSLVTWKLVKSKYEQIAQEEIDSVKEYWARENNEQEHRGYPEDVIRDSSDDEEDVEYTEEDQISMFTYHNLANMYSPAGEDAETDKKGERDEDVQYVNGPHVILPEDFGDGNYDHELRCLTYYSDGILADDWDVKYDIDETIGGDAIDNIGEYAEGVVHVRNERTQCDYEVVLDPRRYKDVVANSPSK